MAFVVGLIGYWSPVWQKDIGSMTAALAIISG